MSPPAFAVAGWKNSGKTTLVERLVAHLTGQGLRVATVKRSHDAFLMDTPGTDTDRHRRAGAEAVVMVGPNGWTLARREPEPDLDDILSALEDYEIVVVEGYKSGPLPVLEVVADPAQPAIRDTDTDVFALATDLPINADLPTFVRDDVEAIADCALARLGLQ